MRYHPVVALVGGLLIHERKGLEHAPVRNQRVLNFDKAVEKADCLVNAFRETAGVPGLSVSVSVGGITVYSKGFGLADVEQSVPASPDTKYRIASISKCFTSLLTARLLEQGKLSLEENIQSYLPDFAPKTVDGKPGLITLKHLLSHTSGIRHYRKVHNVEAEGEKKKNGNNHEPPELLNTKPYDSAQEALEMFRDDALHHQPGEDYTYTTHGYTLISAILESCVARTSPPFDRPLPLSGANKLDDKKKDKTDEKSLPEHAKMSSLLTSLFAFLGLRNTQLDYPNAIIPHRTRQYRRDKKGRLILAPWVDNSYKWGGGGILSSAPDLIQLANHLALIYLDETSATPKVVSRDSLINLLWNPVPGTLQGNWLVGGLYGLGWFVARSLSPFCATTESSPLVVGTFDANACASGLPPIAVAILANMEHASGIGSLAIQLVELLTAELVEYSSRNSDFFQL
ncbi:hypothetical protein AAHC03_05615 [Spirometra sp. Aus1]